MNYKRAEKIFIRLLNKYYKYNPEHLAVGLKKKDIFLNKDLTNEDKKKLLYGLINWKPVYLVGVTTAYGDDFVKDILKEDLKNIGFCVKLIAKCTHVQGGSYYTEESLEEDDFLMATCYDKNFSLIPKETAEKPEFLDKIFDIVIGSKNCTELTRYFSKYNPDYSVNKVQNFILKNLESYDKISFAKQLLKSNLLYNVYSDDFVKRLKTSIDELADRRSKEILDRNKNDNGEIPPKELDRVNNMLGEVEARFIEIKREIKNQLELCNRKNQFLNDKGNLKGTSQTNTSKNSMDFSI